MLVRLEKCAFIQKQLDFLGFEMGWGWWRPSPTKLAPLTSYQIQSDSPTAVFAIVITSITSTMVISRCLRLIGLFFTHPSSLSLSLSSHCLRLVGRDMACGRYFKHFSIKVVHQLVERLQPIWITVRVPSVRQSRFVHVHGLTSPVSLKLTAFSHSQSRSCTRFLVH